MTKTTHSSRWPLPDPQLEEVVLNDLRALGESWKRPISEHSVRDESARLRRLLIDDGGLLQRFRRTLGLKRRAACPGR